MTNVLLIDTPPPSGTHAKVQPFEQRGWCLSEVRMASLTKDPSLLISLNELKGDEAELPQLLERGRAKRPSPLDPDAAFKALEKGLSDGSVTFSNREDMPVVASLYKRAYHAELADATSLFFAKSGWGDDDAVALSRSLTCANGLGLLLKLNALNLSNNKIGDAGCAAIADAASQGALRVLKDLMMLHNSVGDAGMGSLAKVMGDGALNDLVSINLSSNEVADAGAAALAAALRTGNHKKLKMIRLQANKIGEAGMNSLALSFAAGVDCELLDVSRNPASDAAVNVAQAAKK